MSHATRTLVVLAALAAVAAPQAVHARDVKHCGITIGGGETGKLVQNVTCGYRCTSDPTVRCALDARREDYVCPLENSGCQPEEIFLGRNATLDLNGFDLTAAYNQTAIVCSAGTHTRCTIKGPGNFFAAKSTAIVPNNRDVVLQDLLIDRDYGGFITAGWVHATNVRIQNCSSSMAAKKGATVKNASFGGNCGISSGKNLYLDNVASIDGIWAIGTIRGKDVTIQDGRISAKDIFLTRAQIPKPLDPTSTIFRPDVSASRRLVLRDSTVGGIESGVAPKLAGSSCVLSRKAGSTDTWGVCTLD